MRIRILHRPALDFVDGIRLDRFEPGQQYDVGSALGAHLLVEGCASLVHSEEPVLLIPIRDAVAFSLVGDGAEKRH